MNKENIWVDKQCPFYWKRTSNGGVFGRVMDENTKKCILRQTKSNQQGEPGCVYHGSPPPVCQCRGHYLFTNMVKIGKMLWKCSLCKEKIKGWKNQHGYNEYDYCKKECCWRDSEKLSKNE